MNIRDRLFVLAEADAREVALKNRSYGESWCRRGGQQAFAVIWRKCDRIESILEQMKNGYDLFAAWHTNPGDIRDDIRDLRRYLLLLEEYATRPGAIGSATNTTIANDTIHTFKIENKLVAGAPPEILNDPLAVNHFKQWAAEQAAKRTPGCTCQNPDSMADWDCPVHSWGNGRREGFVADQTDPEEEQSLAEQAAALKDAAE